MTWQAPETLPHRPRASARSLLAALTAAGLLLTAAAVPGPCLVAGLALAVGAVALWVVDRREIRLRLLDEHIDPGRGGPPVRYDEITLLKLAGRALVNAESAESGAHLLIGHAGGLWRVPRDAGCERLGLYRWLLERSSLRAEPVSLPGRLEEVRTREAADFGPSQVLATTGRETVPGELPLARWVACLTLALALTGGLGQLLGASELHAKALVGSALGVGLLALLVAGVQSRQQAQLDTLRRAAGLVISPRSLTVEGQGLRGELLWAEVRGLSVVNSRSPLMCGLKLRLEGTVFLLGDHYRRPLGDIEALVRQHLAHG
jgi:hypothetical protein